MTWYRVVTPSFVAGLRADPAGGIVEAAPIIWGMCHKRCLNTVEEIRKYLTSQSGRGTIRPLTDRSPSTGDLMAKYVTGVVNKNTDSKFNDDRRVEIDGNWYSADEDLDGKLKTGNKVKARYVKKGEKTLVIDAVKVLSKGNATSGGGGRGRGGKGGGDDNKLSREEWRAKDSIIGYQNARTAAVTVATTLAEAGALGAKTKLEAAYMAKIDELTVLFFEDAHREDLAKLAAGKDPLGAVARVHGEVDEDDELDDEEDEDVEDEDDEDFDDDDDDEEDDDDDFD